MPKIRSNSSAKKRFRITAGGVKRNQSHRRHILTKKSTKRKLALTHDTVVDKSDESNVKQMLRLK